MIITNAASMQVLMHPRTTPLPLSISAVESTSTASGKFLVPSGSVAVHAVRGWGSLSPRRASISSKSDSRESSPSSLLDDFKIFKGSSFLGSVLTGAVLGTFASPAMDLQFRECKIDCPLHPAWSSLSYAPPASPATNSYSREALETQSSTNVHKI